jgi:hypothetical protein
MTRKIQTKTAITGHAAESALALGATLLLLLGSCEEDDGPNGTPTDPGAASVGSGDGGGGNAGPRPLYAIANEVYGADTSTTYVNVLPSLDVKDIDYGKAREYAGGRAHIATIGGRLFVSAPESPVITRFSVSDAGVLTEDGRLSFANFGFKAVAVDEWGNIFLSDTKAYLFNSDEGSTVIWNPTTMEITGEINSPELVRDVLTLDGSPPVLYGNRLYRTIYWTDWKAYTFSTDLFLAIYDIENDKLLELIKETRCPALNNRVVKDEQGNLYFGNWIWNVSATLVKGAPNSCALRMAAGSSRFDADWTLPYASLTDGREGAMFSYLGNGKGLLSVFHHERTTIDATTDPSELAGTENWRLWGIDLEKRTGAPIEGLDWNTGAVSTFHLDGRSFVFVPGNDWSVTRIYELKDGRAVPSFEVRGWSYALLKVR